MKAAIELKLKLCSKKVLGCKVSNVDKLWNAYSSEDVVMIENNEMKFVDSETNSGSR